VHSRADVGVGAQRVLICDRIRDPGNLGTMIRTSYALGVDAVVVIEGCDAWVGDSICSAVSVCSCVNCRVV
jgi:tRNA G18 (ribose-2'-O)-methylase SpoU